MPKSGLATKYNLAVHNGVIDNVYRGEIIIHMYNHGEQDYHFKKNDKVAQGFIRKLYSFIASDIIISENGYMAGRGNMGEYISSYYRGNKESISEIMEKYFRKDKLKIK